MTDRRSRRPTCCGDLVPPFPIRLFRIREDRRWNWLAARNRGAHEAADGWLLMTDMDHVIPEATMAAVVTGAHDPAVIYGFRRRESTGAPLASASEFVAVDARAVLVRRRLRRNAVRLLRHGWRLAAALCARGADGNPERRARPARIRRRFEHAPLSAEATGGRGGEAADRARAGRTGGRARCRFPRTKWRCEWTCSRCCATFILADPALAAALGTRVYPIKLPQAVTYPAMTIQRITGVALPPLKGRASLARPRYQCDVWTREGDGSASAEAQRIGAVALGSARGRGVHGRRMTTVSPAEARIVALEFETDRDLYEPDVDGGFYRYSADYFVHHQTGHGHVNRRDTEGGIMADGLVAQGSYLLFETAAGSPPTFIEIAEVTNISGAGGTTERIDFTHLRSPGRRREYKPSFIESGVLTFTCAVHPAGCVAYPAAGAAGFRRGSPDARSVRRRHPAGTTSATSPAWRRPGRTSAAKCN